MTARLLLDEHYGDAITAELRGLGHDVVAAVANPDLRGASDPEVFRWAAENGRRVVTENIKDCRPLLLRGESAGTPAAPLLLVPFVVFRTAGGDRTAAIVAALHGCLCRPDVDRRPAETG